MTLNDQIDAIAVPDIHYEVAALSGLSDGAPVSTWASRVGGTDLTTLSGYTNPTYVANIGDGHPGVKFDISPGTMVMGGEVFASGWDAGFTVIAVWRGVKSRGGTPYMLSCSNGDFILGTLGQGVIPGGGFLWTMGSMNGQQAFNVGGSTFNEGCTFANQTYGYSWDAAGAGQLLTENRVATFTSTGTQTPTGYLRVGDPMYDTNNMQIGYFREVLVWKGRLADSDMQAIFALVMQKYGRDTAPDVIYDDDSIVRACNGVQMFLADIDDPGLMRLGSLYNVAQDGNTIVQRQAVSFDTVLPLVNNNKRGTIIVFPCGTNDIGLMADPTDTGEAFNIVWGEGPTHMVGYRGNLLQNMSHGYFVASTVLPRANFTSDMLNIALPTVNSTILSFPYWNAISQRAADSIMGDITTYTSAANDYTQDGIHPLSAGQARLAACDAVAIDTVLDSIFAVTNYGFMGETAGDGTSISVWTGGPYYDADVATTAGTGGFTVSTGGPVTAWGIHSGVFTLTLTTPLNHSDYVTVDYDGTNGALTFGGNHLAAFSGFSVTNLTTEAPNVDGEAGNGEVFLGWDAVGGGGYVVFQGGVQVSSDLNDTFTRITGLTNGTAYSFTVVGMGSGGYGIANSMGKLSTPLILTPTAGSGSSKVSIVTGMSGGICG